jgi:hypothetical protein
MDKLKKATSKVKMTKAVVEKVQVKAGRYEMKNLAQCVRSGSLKALK